MLLFFNASDSVWCLCAGYMSIDKIHELVFPLFSFYYSVDINGFTLWLSQHCNNEQYREVEINLILLSAAQFVAVCVVIWWLTHWYINLPHSSGRLHMTKHRDLFLSNHSRLPEDNKNAFHLSTLHNKIFFFLSWHYAGR